MRRRQVSAVALTPEQLVNEFHRLMADHPLDPAALREGLARLGSDPVAAIRARRWLRRGSPSQRPD